MFQFGFNVIDIAIAYPERFPLQKVKEELKKADSPMETTRTQEPKGNNISPEPQVRKKGVNYTAWEYRTQKSRTKQEWEWSVSAMWEAAAYAKNTGSVNICVEPVNRFESHFLNIAEDAVRYRRDVGTGNVKVHLDAFHMNIEETDFVEAVKTCGKDYLGYVHTCENNRGIPGTGHVPWKAFFSSMKEIGYYGPFIIESFDPSFEEFNAGCAIWRHFTETGEALAV